MTWKEGLFRFRSFWVFPILAVTLVILSSRAETSGRITDLLWLIPCGMALWTLLEYGLHRFVFHPAIDDSPLGRILSGTHLEHHESPQDVERILVRTGHAAGISLFVAVVITLVTRNLFWTSGLLSGIWTGFLYYEYVHYRVHATADSGILISRQRRTHFYHHYRDYGRCFGVTTPLWDYVFRTTQGRLSF